MQPCIGVRWTTGRGRGDQSAPTEMGMKKEQTLNFERCCIAKANTQKMIETSNFFAKLIYLSTPQWAGFKLLN